MEQLSDTGLCTSERPVPAQTDWVAAWELCSGVGEISLSLSTVFGWLTVFMELRFPNVSFHSKVKLNEALPITERVHLLSFPYVTACYW